MTGSLGASLGGTTPEEWARLFLHAAALPITAENVRVVIAWEFAESGGGGGMFNPLNTTQRGFPSTDLNSVGVKNYTSLADGIAANARVLHNGFYGPVVDAFQRGDDAAAVVAAIVRSPWGTRHIALGPPLADPLPSPHAHPEAHVSVPVLYAAKDQPVPSRFCGAAVDVAAHTLLGRGGAGVTPPTTVIKPDRPWFSSREIEPDAQGETRFVIVTNDNNEYIFTVRAPARPR